MFQCQGERDDNNSSVHVAIRIRPQNAKEKMDMCHICTAVTDKGRQVILGKDKAFTFDFVFDGHTQQDDVYNTCISNLVEGCFEGYNATVFAYGQTGSGKTYTMGTGFDTSIITITEEIGIVPRAVDHLFKGIEKRRSLALEKQEPTPEFKVTAQFMELYNEEIIDLLEASKDPLFKGKKSAHRIHEDASGGIYIVGVTIRPVSSLDDTLQCLKSGVLSRATASTNMNISSSRSHAIFTLHIRQHRVVKEEISLDGGKDTDSTQTEFETLTAKFHFVDLAGSERLKRTGATGNRAKEGISINCGLLALGNVISALGDNAKRGNHVPYRDSKLTRLLQDSLGGNSRTLMIACISPSDRDFMETVNTLKYANRARNIKNKVIANQDKSSKQLALLKAEIQSLQQELLEFKMSKKTIDASGLESVSDMVMENSLLQLEKDQLRNRMIALQDTVETVKTRNIQLLADAALSSLVGSDGQTIHADVSNLIKKYIQEIEDLKTRLVESESTCEHLSKSSLWSSRSLSSRMSHSSTSVSSSAGEMYASSSPVYMETSALCDAKKEMRRLKKLQKLNLHKVSRGGDLDKLLSKGDKLITSEEKSEDERNGCVGDEENDTDAEEEDSESDTSLDSGNRESDNIHEDLTKLTCEITIKQRLIGELENTQKTMNALKAHYENRVQQLQLKIRETEMERDRVLSDIEQMSNSSTDTTKKVQKEFEKKLLFLQDELKKMQAEQRKHAKMQKNSLQYEQHLKTLQHDLAEMKKSKVRLMKQVKEEVDKNKKNENRNNKELNQLRKERQKMDNIIKNLERQTAQKDAVIKQKQEEVEALRKGQKPLSCKAGKHGRSTNSIVQTPRQKKRSDFSSKVAKQKWDSMEENIESIISKHQNITMLERDMDVWLKLREKCTKEIEKYQQQMQEAINLKQPEELIHKLSSTIEYLSLKVQHAQENIVECQSSIMQMEESKEDGDVGTEINSLLATITLEETKYIIEKLYQRTLDKGLSMVQQKSEVRRLQGRLQQTELNNALQQNLLRYMMDDYVNIEMDDLTTHSDLDDIESTSRPTLLCARPSSLSAAGGFSFKVMDNLSQTLHRAAKHFMCWYKARKKKVTTHNLLYAGGSKLARTVHLQLETLDELNKYVTIVTIEIPKYSARIMSQKTVDRSDDVSAKNGPVSEVETTEGEFNYYLSNENQLVPLSYLAVRQRSICSRSSKC